MNIPGYRIERELAHGGMATVYLAVQESLARQVALKIMAPALAADRSFGERFLKEARTVARLHHPHILAVHDVGVDGHHYYLAMEYVPGGDLKQRIRQGALPPKDALQIAKQMAQALGYSHAEGFVHRDVKPENILFRKDGTAVLSDFGIAKAVGSGTKKTGTGMSIGTPHYMSPEQAQGKSDLDGRSDLYSLGVVVYEMLSGTVPFDADNTIGIAMQHVSAPVPQLPKPVAKLQPLLDQLLAKDPARRYANAAELVTAIDQALAGQLPAAAKAAHTQVIKLAAAPAEPKKGSALKWAIGGALLAVLLVGGVLLSTGGTKPRVAIGGSGGSLPAVQAQIPLDPPLPKGETQMPLTSLAKGDAILQITSDPVGASVKLDGVELGTTPLTRSDLPAGPHELRLQLAYHQEHQETIQLGSAEVLKQQIALQRGQGKLTVLTNPSGAGVSLDGKQQKEKTPLTLSDIPAGPHSVKVHLDTYYDQDESVEVQHQQTSKLDLTFKGGHLVKYQGEWLEPEDVATRKAEAARIQAEKERQAEAAKRARFENLVSAGRQAIGQRKPGPALSKLQDALRLYPSDSNAKNLLAQAEALKEYTDPVTGMEFVLVEGGCYQMGSNSGESDEKPVHEVCVDDFYIGKYEVTQDQYQKITGNNPSRFNGSDRPVEQVSWDDAQSYIQQLNRRGVIHHARDSRIAPYRLPTEAEWGYAARSGGKNETYAGGNNVDAVAWYASNSGNQTHPVGQKQANGLGLYDMSGNVWEWCQDWYGSYEGRSQRNPQGPSSGSYRVLRGGSWSNIAGHARAAIRNRYTPGIRDGYLGFRLVLPTVQ